VSGTEGTERGDAAGGAPSADGTDADAPSLGAIVLAGGRGTRLGGIDKAAVELAGERLVDRVVAAARACGADPVVVVGPNRPAPPGVVVVREDPPFAGPLAALAAGLDALSSAARSETATPPWTLLLSCDLVDPDGVCRALTAALRADPDPELDGLLLRDPEGREQWLAGAYRVAALRGGIGAAAPLAARPLRLAFADARLRHLAAPAELTADIDTPADLERARSSTRARGARMASSSQHLPPEALDRWLEAAAAELGLDAATVDIGTVLDVARDVAHGVARPAAPLSTFLLGLAVGRAEGRSGDPATELASRARTLTELAERWE